jgi:transposase
MEIVQAWCCGLDVHKRTVVACLLVSGLNQALSSEVRTVGTMTQDLLDLADWLALAGCTPGAMESTGVYTLPTMLPSVGSVV